MSIKLLLLIVLASPVFAVTISPASGALASGKLGTAYAAPLTATGTGPFSWAVTAGQTTLNSWGLSRSAATGTSINIAGTPACPTQGGGNPSECETADEPMFNTPFTITVTDTGAGNATASATYTIALYWNPSLAMFLSTSAYRQENLLALAADTSTATPPAVGCLLLFSNAVFMTAGSANLTTYKAYVDVEAHSGCKVISIYPDMASYVTNTAKAATNRQLYTDIVAYIRANYGGIKVHVRPEYHGPGTVQAGAEQINATPGGCTVTTVMTWDVCVNGTTRAWLGGVSAYRYIANTLKPDQFDPTHEPSTICSFWGQAAGVTDCVASGTSSWSQFMLDSIAQVTAGCPSGCAVGIALFLPELNGTGAGGDLSYNGTTQTNVGGTWTSHLIAVAGLDAFGVDIYALGVSNMTQFTTAFTQAKNNGKIPYVAEWGIERWVPSGSTTTEQNAIKGCLSATWEKTRHRENHVYAFLMYLASQGVATATLFPTASLFDANVSWPDSCWPGSTAVTGATFLAAVNAKKQSYFGWYLNQLLANWPKSALR